MKNDENIQRALADEAAGYVADEATDEVREVRESGTTDAVVTEAASRPADEVADDVVAEAARGACEVHGASGTHELHEPLESPQAREPLESKIVRLKHELASVPALPGVYLWKDTRGQVIYVGKAKQLRARMRQYINFQDERAKIPLLVDQIASFDYIVVENEHESLVLEKNLIKQHSPFFNADFKDDKSYPFIAITKSDVFPAIKYTREKHKDNVRYFGPFTDSRAARCMLDVARRVVPLCAATCAQWRRMNRAFEHGAGLPGKNEHPCFDAHVGLGPGACCGKITPDEYAENVKRIERFLAGNRREFLSELSAEMNSAAEELDFERAARVKARIDAINSLASKQHAISEHNLCADVVGLFREETVAGVHVLMLREGCIINSNEFILNRGADVPNDDLIHMFLLRYYDASDTLPHEIIVRELPEDAPAMQAWLTQKLASSHGAKVHFSVPERGEKAELLNMAEKNAKHALMRYKVRTNYDETRINKALLQLESALALDGPPMRIECFDISTIHGSYTVASMVVFTNGKPDKSQYRRFKIKAELDEANDFLSMQEVMARRYSPLRMKDERFGKKPDLIILDGGKPQLSAACKMFEQMGIDDIALCGLAKRDEELFVTWQESGPVVLPNGSASLYLVKQVRDEAHRFAITFHRELRNKGMSASLLDEVVGLGPVRKRALLKHFKSFRRLSTASLEEIKNAHLVPEEVARELYIVLQQYNKEDKLDGQAHKGADT